MPPATRSRTAADSTNDEATTTGATPDDAPDAESATHVHVGTGSRSATDGMAARGPAPATAHPVRTAGRRATPQVKQVEAVADDIASTARRPDAVMDWGRPRRTGRPRQPRTAGCRGSPLSAPSPGHHRTHRLESHREPGLEPDRQHGRLGRANARQP